MKTKNPISILLVEDDAFYAGMVKDYLKSNGFPGIQLARNGIECLLEIHEEKAPDVVILDQNLGKLNGLDLLRRILAFNPDIKVLFISGQNQIDTAIKALKYGAMDFFLKDEQVFARLLPALKEISEEKEKISSMSWFKKVAHMNPMYS
jgi:polysaccharide export outer membrane protein